jgi:hypothetical protein
VAVDALADKRTDCTDIAKGQGLVVMKFSCLGTHGYLCEAGGYSTCVRRVGTVLVVSDFLSREPGSELRSTALGRGHC